MIYLFACEACEKPLLKPYPALCLFCVEYLNEERKLSPYLQKTALIEQSFALYLMVGFTHSLLLSWKKHPKRNLERLLFQLDPQLKKFLIEQKYDFIVSAPQSEKRELVLEGGSAYRFSEFVANVLKTTLLPIGLMSELLDSQKDLSQFERKFSHVSHAIRTSKNERRRVRKILICDDFQTTGETLSRLARSLRNDFGHHSLCLHSITLGYRPTRYHF